MKTLQFAYEMTIAYSEDVNRCNFTIKCIPKNTARQQILETEITLDPETPYCEGVDGLGNLQIYGVNEKPHRSFQFRITGKVRTGQCEYEEEGVEEQIMIFRHPHGLNVPGKEIKAYFDRINLESRISAYEKAVELMHRLHEDFRYQTGSTNVDTSAEDAWKQGCGVCQDYTHIYISLLHLAGIPARYVTGLIVGEGASHAWAEILDGGKWYGLDPTNDCAVTEEHIRIGIGRDAKDCMINRGIMHGGGWHTQTVAVHVEE